MGGRGVEVGGDGGCGVDVGLYGVGIGGYGGIWGEVGGRGMDVGHTGPWGRAAGLAVSRSTAARRC